jgi:branched-chain amino acid aminotransferase
MFAIINSDIVPYERAFIHASDLAIHRGYGIFDFLKVVRGHPYFLDDYLDRFYHSASVMRLAIPLERNEITDLVFELIKRNAMESSGVKMILTGGYSPDGYQPDRPNLIITQHELVLPPEELIRKGVHVITHEHVRDIPTVKTINYTMGIWLIDKVKTAGAYDVLYHQDGIVSEFPRSNFFIVRKDGVVATPAKNVLGGVTRKNILKIASRHFEAIEAEVTLKDVQEAREAFISSTTKRVLPVIKVDHHLIGNGIPGPVSAKLLAELIALERTDYNNSVISTR